MEQIELDNRVGIIRFVVGQVFGSRWYTWLFNLITLDYQMLWSAHCRTPRNDASFQVVFCHRQASKACLQCYRISLEPLMIHLDRSSVEDLYQERRIPFRHLFWKKRKKRKVRELSKGKAALPFSPSTMSFSSDQNKWPKINTTGIICHQRQMLLKFSRKQRLKRLKQNCPCVFQTVVFRILMLLNWLYQHRFGQGNKKTTIKTAKRCCNIVSMPHWPGKDRKPSESASHYQMRGSELTTAFTWSCSLGFLHVGLIK